MTTIGITGSIGTGKSFVAALLKRKGALVINADRLAHRAIEKKGLPYRKIVKRFGRGILASNGAIDRTKLAVAAFADQASCAALNRIVHPVVVGAIRCAVRRAPKGRIVVIDAPLLIEAGLARAVDLLVVVTASRATQVARCRKKFGMSKARVLERIRCQMPLGKKAALADYRIDNNGTKKQTERGIEALWQRLNAKNAKSAKTKK